MPRWRFLSMILRLHALAISGRDRISRSERCAFERCLILLPLLAAAALELVFASHATMIFSFYRARIRAKPYPPAMPRMPQRADECRDFAELPPSKNGDFDAVKPSPLFSLILYM